MAATRPSNLLFLLTDEQRADTLACYGNNYVDMPNLNALAERSCIWDDVHCTDPVCTPSRGSIMTGLYPHAHGATTNNIPLDADAKCLPELLSDDVRQKYRAEYHGKWHLGDELYAQHGFERFVSVEDAYHKYFSDKRDQSDRSDYHHFLVGNGFTLGKNDRFPRDFAARLPERYSKPKFQADQACSFIRQHQHQPWMLTVSILEPHMPFYSCRDGQYRPEDVPMFSNFDHVPDQDPDSQLVELVRERLQHHREHGYEGHDLTTEQGWRELTARYLGLCSLVDTQMGRILQTLQQCGLDENTIVVFASDHGEYMGSHRLLTKGLLYREATRVPLLIRLPGQEHAVRLNGPASQIDLVPTLLELMGQNAPTDLHGNSLADLMNNAVAGKKRSVDITGTASDCVIVQGAKQTRTLISPDNWRYSCYAATGEFELFDLNSDPGERYNLAHNPDQIDRLSRMHEQLIDWQQRTQDTLQLPTPAIQSSQN